MGYELKPTRAALGMLFAGERPESIPGGPRARKPDEPENEIGMYGGSLNHDLLALWARLLWCCLTLGVADSRTQAHLDAAVGRLTYQLTTAFMCRGKAAEFFPPSHQQWHLAPVLGLLDVALAYGFETLARACLAWLQSWLAICDLFAPMRPWERLRKPPTKALLVVGHRAYTDEAGHGEPSRNFVGDTFWSRVRAGDDLASQVMAGGIVGPDAGSLQDLDSATFYLYRRVLQKAPAVAKILNQPADVPPLRFPIEIQRRGEDKIAYMLRIEEPGDGKKPADWVTQRLAGWYAGEVLIGFDDAKPPRLTAADVRVEYGHARPEASWPDAPMVGELVAAGAPVVRQPGVDDLPPGLKALVVTGSMTLEAAVKRARRHRKDFAKRWPEGE